MRTVVEMEKHIRNNWFPKHVATVTEAGPTTILDWKEPGTNLCYIRYVMVDSDLFITGDSGEAVFNLNWDAKINSFSEIHIRKLLKCLSCSSVDRWSFSEEKAKEELKDWFEEKTMDIEDEERIQSITKLYTDLVAITEESTIVAHYETAVWNLYAETEVQIETEEMQDIAEFGREFPMAFVAFLLGLKMANKQLKKQQAAI